MAGKLSGSAIEANTITATQLSSNISNVRFGSTDQYANVARIFVGSSPDVTIANVTNYGGTAANGLIIQTGYIDPNPNNNQIGGLKITNEGVVVFGAGYDDVFRVVSKNGVYGEDVILRVWGDGLTRGVTIGGPSPDNGPPSYNDGLFVAGPIETRSRLYFHESSFSAEVSLRNVNNNLILETTFNANNVVLSDNGNVGIGTTNPGNLLHVEKSFAGTIAKIKNTRGSASTDAGLEIETSTTAAKSLLVKNSGTDRFWVQGDGTAHFNGSVGIGTTLPAARFHVNGAMISTDELGLPSSGKNIEISWQTSQDRARIISYDRSNSVYKTLTINDGALCIVGGGASGNVGIGLTNPGVKLHVEDGSLLVGDISGGSTSTPSGFRIQLDNSFAAGTSSTSYFPKIVMHDATTWLGGFGISDSHVDYFSGGSHRWFTGTNPSTPTRGTERLKIWDSGYVTMPTQTMFAAEHSGTEAPAGGNPLLSWSVDINQGGGSWNASTATYTVPVAGKYLVTCSLLRNTGGAAGGVHLRVNGAIVLRLFYVDSTGTTAYAMGSGQYIVNCAASDTIQITNENTVSWYGDGTGLGSLTINLLG